MSLHEVKVKLAEKYEHMAKLAKSKTKRFKLSNRAKSHRKAAQTASSKTA